MKRLTAVSLVLIFGICCLGCSKSSETPVTKIDILFVIDNSASMVAEQHQLANAFAGFISTIAAAYPDGYQVGVITTGVQSADCQACDLQNTTSCINQTGESGRLQDLLWKNYGTVDAPDYGVTVQVESCKIITSENTDCFWDPQTQSGTALSGAAGCGYERGLEAVRLALGENLRGSYNQGFLRDDAALAVIVVSDEEDCGKAGDVSEGLPDGGNVCYFAANGADGDGNTADSNGKPYVLTPVADYYNFLVGLKGKNKVKFAAIAGVTDEQDPSTTTIEFSFNPAYGFSPVSACITSGCDYYCHALPSTRYIELALMFEENGLIKTICQTDFAKVMSGVAEFLITGTDPGPLTACGPVKKCYANSQVCVKSGPVGPSYSYACEAVPTGCEDNRTCACLGASYCIGSFDTCSDQGENTIFCECTMCQ